MAKSLAELAAGSQETVKAATEIKDSFSKPVAVQFGFVGAGQGGGRIAGAFSENGYRKLVAVNTTANDFGGLPAKMLTCALGGDGAAKDMEYARKVYKDQEDTVWDALSRAWGTGVEWPIVCASLGGGTGSGFALPLTRTVKRLMAHQGKPERVGAVVSLPSIDSQQSARNALTALAELVKAKVSPLLVIDNQRIHKKYKPSAKDFHATANTVVAAFLHSFNERAAEHSPYCSFDKREFLQLLSGGILAVGHGLLPLGGIKTPTDVSAAVRDTFSDNVLLAVDVRTTNAAACILSAGPEVLSGFSMDFFDAGFSQVSRLLRTSDSTQPPAVVHRGLYEQEANQLEILTMFAGVALPAERLAQLFTEANFADKTPLLAAFGLKEQP